jgi:hypothetical protein
MDQKPSKYSGRYKTDMSVIGPSKSPDAIHRLKQQIQELGDEQTEARKMAALVGMTPAEAKDYDDRRSRITQLNDVLANLGMTES